MENNRNLKIEDLIVAQNQRLYIPETKWITENGLEVDVWGSIEYKPETDTYFVELGFQATESYEVWDSETCMTLQQAVDYINNYDINIHNNTFALQMQCDS